MRRAVCVIVRNENNLYLCVSRKDNHQDWGFPGGKVDPEDSVMVDGQEIELTTLETAIVRETKEETGLSLHSMRLIDKRVWGGYRQHCFIGEVSGTIEFDEPHLVEWLDIDRLLENSSFAEYNRMILGMLGHTKDS
jgi:8-oxo-dGTP pyrophosphatase MutT (NUDIX family)